MIITPNMGLKAWNLLADLFDHGALSDNWTAVDNHDHSFGNGVPINTAGLANGAVTAAKVASNTLTSTQVQVAGGGIVTHSSDLAANRPTAQYRGRLFYSTDTGAWQIDNNSQWSPINLALRNTTSSQAANNGEILAATVGNLTFTLPPPTEYTTCGFFCASPAITGANPITITATGGAFINALGTAGPTSITLGTRGSYIVLQSNGINWLAISGQQDSGWIPLNLTGGGVSAMAGYYVPAARFRGDLVELRGGIFNGGIAQTGPGLTWGTVPTICIPPKPVVIASSSNAIGPLAVQIDTSGNINVFQGSWSNGTEIFLDGSFYSMVP